MPPPREPLDADGAAGARGGGSLVTALDVVICLSILVLALGLRAVPLEGGFPFLQRSPEEPQHLERALGVATGDLDPDWFIYPSLHYYLLGATLRIVHGSDVGDDPLAHWNVRFARTSRWLSLALGLGTTLLMYVAGRMLGGRITGSVAAVLTAVNPLHVRVTTSTAVDPSLSFFMVLTVVALISVVTSPTRRRCLFAGVAAGLAGSAKYPGLALLGILGVTFVAATRRAPDRIRPVGRHAPLMVVVALALVSGACLLALALGVEPLFRAIGSIASLDPRRVTEEMPRIVRVGTSMLLITGVASGGLAVATARSLHLRRAASDGRLLLALSAGILAFFATSPYLLLDPSQSSRDLVTIVSMGSQEGRSAGITEGLGRYAGLLARDFGVPWLVMGAVFAVRELRRGSTAVLALALVVVVYVLAASRFVTHHPHYVLPATHAVDLICAGGVAMLATGVRSPRRRAALLAVLLSLVVATPVARSVEWIRHNVKPHVDLVALEWMEEHIPEGATFARVAETPQLEILGSRYTVHYVAYRVEELTEAFFAAQDVDYVLLSEKQEAHFREDEEAFAGQLAVLDRIRRSHTLVRSFEAVPERQGGTVHLYHVARSNAGG